MQAPQFSLLDQDKNTVTLDQFAGKWVLLYFYPKDDTPGCTAQACGLRDVFADFQGKNVTILGVSKDSASAHKKFIAKYDLPFSLLSDPSTEMIQAYGAWGSKKFMGREFDGILRTSFLISPAGEIAKRYDGVVPATHAQTILADLEELQSA